MDILSEDFGIIESSYQDVLNELKGARIIVTGSYGMITSYLCNFLIDISEKYELTLCLQGRNSHKLNDKYGSFVPSGRVILSNFDFENGVFPDFAPDYIIHAASAASTKFFNECPVDVMRPNIIGTWNLLNFAKDKNVKKFLFFSSNSIYGEGGISKSELSEIDYGIVDPLSDRACYIESKRVSEQMCRSFFRQYNVPTSVVRICHTYGPTFDLNDTRIIPRTVKKILNNEDVIIYRDPDSVVQYTYIADMISAFLIVLVKGENGEAYNCGGDEIVKMDDVIEWMIHADSRIKSKLVEKEIDGNYNFAKGKGVNFKKISNSKLKSLGWKNMFTNKDGFTRTVRHYLNNIN